LRHASICSSLAITFDFRRHLGVVLVLLVLGFIEVLWISHVAHERSLQRHEHGSIAKPVITSACKRHNLLDLRSVVAFDHQWHISHLSAAGETKRTHRWAQWSESLLHSQGSNVGENVVANGIFLHHAWN